MNAGSPVLEYHICSNINQRARSFIGTLSEMDRQRYGTLVTPLSLEQRSQVQFPELSPSKRVSTA